MPTIGGSEGGEKGDIQGKIGLKNRNWGKGGDSAVGNSQLFFTLKFEKIEKKREK